MYAKLVRVILARRAQGVIGHQTAIDRQGVGRSEEAHVATQR